MKSKEKLLPIKYVSFEKDWDKKNYKIIDLEKLIIKIRKEFMLNAV